MHSTVLFRKLVYAIGLFLLPAPLFLLAGSACGVGWTLLLPLMAALVLGLLAGRLRPRFRLPCTMLGVVGCMALSFLLTRDAWDWGWKWAGAVLSGLAALRYPRDARRMLEGAATSSLWLIGLAVIVFVRFAGALNPLPEAGAMMDRFIWIYCIFLIFALNLDSLTQGIGLEKAPSRTMLFKNAAVSMGWAGLFLLVTHIPQVTQAFRACMNAAVRAFVWLTDLLTSLFSTPADGVRSGGNSGFFGLVGETQEPSWLMVALEKVLHVITAILFAAAVFLLLRLICRALVNAWKKLKKYLRAYMDAVSENYEDQVESLLDWGEVKREIRERRQKRQQSREERIPWERLDPRQQVRRSYRDFLIRHPDIPPQSTARRSLSDPRQAEVYEAARYSSREITPEEAQSVRNIRQ